MLFAMGWMVCVPMSAQAKTYDLLITEAAARMQVPPEWIAAVLQSESAGDMKAVSAKGAMGLMQLMPATWTDLRRMLALGADPFDAHDNILAGAAYLRMLHERYGDAGFLAAYNAGPGRYDEHLATGRPLPQETLAYVEAVRARLRGDSPLAGQGTSRTVWPRREWQAASLFIAPSDHPDIIMPRAEIMQRNGSGNAVRTLFVGHFSGLPNVSPLSVQEGRKS
ncbi:lytic transglycosylase domain-containing protein [Gluconacetobacter entanii]|uniref:Lytic transglycosylase n=1 Tax=Gluconacetobacter entanii TaxID=108528 RepID=A0A318PQ46_9PROT|nr:lytic transglycosylase domain-containing protein [Gluconacetobacter entanii]PYD62369.1 lytic transglycosylase [Gluconacetobacter entanii]